MDLKELRENSRKMIATFVDSIDLDGEWYSGLNTTPLVWGTPKFNGCGEFASPGSERLESILQAKNYDDKTRKILNQKGMILINKSYKQQEADSDLYVTLIHETFHANRDLLLFDSFREGRNESAYSYNNGRFEQNTYASEYAKHADASQEILKGSIDTSRTTVDSYASKTSKEIEDIGGEGEENKTDAQMEKQNKVDEALVEIMARLSFYLYKAKERGKNPDIWDLIKKIGNDTKEEYYELKEMDSEFKNMGRDTILAKDRKVMCDILIKHHDYELFNWMIDPITYSQGDMHYDFFEKYTKNDQDLLDKIYNDEWEVEIGEEIFTDLPDVGKITTSDIKEVASSETAIEELSSSYADITQAQTQKRKDNER